MIRTGGVIENPITGETMVFLRTGEDTDGELLQVDLFVGPDGSSMGEHLHPVQEERFLIRSGEMTLELAGEQRVLRPGDEAIVPAGTEHSWWNSGPGELNVILEHRPAGRMGSFTETVFGLAKADQTDEDGFPGLLQAALTLRAYDDTIVMTGVAPAVARYVLPVLAFIGRMFGLRPDYPYPRRSRINRGMEIWRPDEMTVT